MDKLPYATELLVAQVSTSGATVWRGAQQLFIVVVIVIVIPGSSDYRVDSSPGFFFPITTSGANMIGSRRLCYSVIGIADGILEDTEMISLQLIYLGAAPMRLVLLQPNVTVLEILDLDGN